MTVYDQYSIMPPVYLLHVSNKRYLIAYVNGYIILLRLRYHKITQLIYIDVYNITGFNVLKSFKIQLKGTVLLFSDYLE